MALPLLARIVRFGGGRLLNHTVDRWLPARVGKAKPGLDKALAGAALTRLATRSVPGAIVVGGGMLAKLLYDRRHKDRQGNSSAAADEEDGDAIG